MKRFKVNIWYNIVIGVVLVLLMATIVVLKLENNELLEKNHVYEQEVKYREFIPLVETYIYLSNNAVIYDYVTNYQSKDQIKSVEMYPIYKAEIESLVDKHEITFWQKNNNLCIRVQLFSHASDETAKLYELISETPQVIGVWIVESTGRERGFDSGQFINTPPV